MPRRALAFAVSVVLLVAPVDAAAPPAPFRVAAGALLACFDRQAGIASGRREPALAYADRIRSGCAAEIAAVLAYAGGPADRRRLRGALRAATSDAVIAYDARMTFAAGAAPDRTEPSLPPPHPLRPLPGTMPRGGG